MVTSSSTRRPEGQRWGRGGPAWDRCRRLLPSLSCHQFLISTLPLQEPQWATPSLFLLPPTLFAPPTSPLAIFSRCRAGSEDRPAPTCLFTARRRTGSRPRPPQLQEAGARVLSMCEQAGARGDWGARPKALPLRLSQSAGSAARAAPRGAAPLRPCAPGAAFTLSPRGGHAGRVCLPA